MPPGAYRLVVVEWCNFIRNHCQIQDLFSIHNILVEFHKFLEFQNSRNLFLAQSYQWKITILVTQGHIKMTENKEVSGWEVSNYQKPFKQWILCTFLEMLQNLILLLSVINFETSFINTKSYIALVTIVVRLYLFLCFVVINWACSVKVENKSDRGTCPVSDDL